MHERRGDFALPHLFDRPPHMREPYFMDGTTVTRAAQGATNLTLTTASPSPSRSPVSRTGTPLILQSCTIPPSVCRPVARSSPDGASAASIASSAALIAVVP